MSCVNLYPPLPSLQGQEDLVSDGFNLKVKAAHSRGHWVLVSWTFQLPAGPGWADAQAGAGL